MPMTCWNIFCIKVSFHWCNDLLVQILTPVKIMNFLQHARENFTRQSIMSSERRVFETIHFKVKLKIYLYVHKRIGQMVWPYFSEDRFEVLEVNHSTEYLHKQDMQMALSLISIFWQQFFDVELHLRFRYRGAGTVSQCGGVKKRKWRNATIAMPNNNKMAATKMS
jgi:hypothetical protein